MEPLDRETVTRLTQNTLAPIRDHLRTSDLSPARVLEALNALACCAALVLEGTNFDKKAIAFFWLAVNQQIADATTQPRPADPANDEPKG